MKTRNSIKILITLFVLGGLSSKAQLALNNNGSLALQIDDGLVVHSEGDFANLNTSSLVFESSGEPHLEFDGDFTNGTSATLTAGLGLLDLTGGASQNLDFGGDDLYNLEINNAAGGIFTRAATVNNEVQFTTGDFTTTDSELLIFETSASAVGASDASHVNGPVAKNFSFASVFTFPVGHGSTYNSIAFTPNSGGLTTMKAKYNFSQPSARSSKGAGVCKVSNVEYWDLTRTSGSEDGVVTLEWDTESDVTVLGDLLVAYWDGTNWQDGGGTASGAAGSGTIPTGISMSSFNTYTVGTDPCNNPLPIELVEFKAVPMNNEVVDVNWVTASEINNDYFVIERSKDGFNYAPVDSVKSHGDGNSFDLQNYGYIDKQPFSGVSYYRLRQVDFDQTHSYSNIEVVNFEGLEIITLFPNPSSGDVNIVVKSSEAGTITLTVYDAIGKIVKSEVFQVMEGNTQLGSTLKGASGKYFVSVVTSSGKFYDYDVILMK
jgi:hypothetical protein